MSDNEQIVFEKFLVINIAKAKYAVPVEMVLEILTPTITTTIPFVPDYVRGIMNLRGRLLPVIDLQKIFNNESVNKNKEECFVVVEFDNYTVAIVGNRVEDVFEIDKKDIQTNDSREYIEGILSTDDESYIFINLPKLIPSS